MESTGAATATRTGSQRAQPATRGVRRALAPIEAASAGVLAGFAVAAALAGAILPGGASSISSLASVPLAILGTEHRWRTIITAAAASALTSSVLAGISAGIGTWISCVVGVAAGRLRRHHAGRAATLVTGLLVGIGMAALAIGALVVLRDTRELILESFRASMDGALRALAAVPGLGSAATSGRDGVRWIVEHWWVWIAGTVILAMVLSVLLARWALDLVMGRLHLQVPVDRLEEALAAEARGQRIEPLPVRLSGVGHTYPGASRPALSGVNLTLGPGEFVAVTGSNGSGKTTLSTLLAGATPSEGTIDRPGSPGVGCPGGTAVLDQRTETQGLGATVLEDLAWGLPALDPAEAEAALARVGLAGRGDDPPASLSGGQRQRLALATAIVRRPALLLSDETTAMIDGPGRTDLLGVLAELPANGTTVVHVTHDASEVMAFADRVVAVEAGRIVFDGTPQAWAARGHAPAAPQTAASLAAEHALAASAEGGVRAAAGAAAAYPAHPATTAPPVLRLRAVTHVHAHRTPWARTALHDITLDLAAGEGLLVVGSNGAGKSTLARVMTGLVRPTQGTCELGGRAVADQLGEVGLAMQFPRLQLQRPTVALDILDAAHVRPGVPDAMRRDLVARALADVGLDEDVAAQPIDDLSGGQLRRVALAGILARRPKVLVLDEPFAGVDATTREQLVRVLDARRRAGLALVVITHDEEGLAAVCTRRAHLDAGRLTVVTT